MDKFITCLFVVVFAVMPGGPPEARAQHEAAEEYAIKAAFLYNFAKFVEWPAEAFPNEQTPLTICVLGDNPFGDALESIKGKTIGSRKVVIKEIGGIEGAGACHTLFISASEKPRLSDIISPINKTAVLTIGDMSGFARSGGIIGFVMVDKKIRFEINLGLAQQAKLKISSQLLKLARTVIE